ncbi:MAG: hypothetical protein NVV62_16695 [Terricaulis sp.]|nr:hypothetical protein [Terricaulis sp.]
MATDFQSWHQVVFNSGPLRPAIAGSISMPSIFKPIVHNGPILVDGAVVNPLPLDQADIGTDFLIGIDVNGDPSVGINKTDHRPLDIWFGSAQIMMHSLIAHSMAAYPPDILGVSGPMLPFRRHGILAGARDHHPCGIGKDRFKHMLTRKIEDYIQNKVEPIQSNQR